MVREREGLVPTLTALKRSSLGLDLYLWLVYRTFTLRYFSDAEIRAFIYPIADSISHLLALRELPA